MAIVPPAPHYLTISLHCGAQVLVQMKFGDTFDSCLTNDGPVADCFRLYCPFRQTGALSNDPVPRSWKIDGMIIIKMREAD